jgi:hypothetical protein
MGGGSHRSSFVRPTLIGLPPSDLPPNIELAKGRVEIILKVLYFNNLKYKLL